MELVQTSTRDGYRLDGSFQEANSTKSPRLPLDGLCLVHGTGGSFYSSALFDALASPIGELGCGVLRVNTRGHDLMSTAATAQGGRRQGAAYEIVDECRHDLVAWLGWLRQRVGPRVALVGHSLGAVKCLYAMANEPALQSACVVAISPPRLSYSWFCAGPEGAEFRDTIAVAERHVASGRLETLLEIRLPLPMVITAAGYLEKYGPEERYNYLRFLARVPCPVLLTLGSIEVATNMAFRGCPEELGTLVANAGRRRIAVVAVEGGDHFYTAVRPQLVARIIDWLRTLESSP